MEPLKRAMRSPNSPQAASWERPSSSETFHMLRVNDETRAQIPADVDRSTEATIDADHFARPLGDFTRIASS